MAVGDRSAKNSSRQKKGALSGAPPAYGLGAAAAQAVECALRCSAA